MSLYSHASAAMPFMTGQGLGGRTVPGLPATRPPGFAKRPGLSSLNLGATVTQLNGQVPKSAMVGGQPSIELNRRARGGVTTTIHRSSSYTDFLTAADIATIRRIAQKMVADAQESSQGPLTRAELRRRNHPYGRGYKVKGGRFMTKGVRRGGLGQIQGRQAGVSNLTIINSQSGKLAQAWRAEVNIYKSGVDINLINTKRYAGYLAFGTGRMKAHGPFTSSVVKNLPELNTAWLQATRHAFMRYQLLERFNGGGSLYG